jgi:hypothetical protein
MDLLYFVDERLKFIRYFYESTVAVFQERIRKIEAGEPPYVDTRDPEYADEPAFLEEWQNADAAVNIAGATCLELLQSTFHSYLDEYMREIGQVHLRAQLREMKKKSWFGNYRALFVEVLAIDWNASGADIDLLEQVILARNDFTHNLEFTHLKAYQTPAHSEKYPNSAFADPRWRTLMFKGPPLVVTEETLERATTTLHQLCEYLERERGKFIWRLRANRRGETSKA